MKPRKTPPQLSRFERIGLQVAPRWMTRRLAARARYELAREIVGRSYEGGTRGRRTAGWKTPGSDPNAAAGPYLSIMRNRARDLTRNNPWARRGVEAIVNNVVAWGILTQCPNARMLEQWNAWAGSTICDYYGRRNYYSLQALAMRTIVESGEVLVIRHRDPRPENPLGFQIQILEPDYLDTAKTVAIGNGAEVIQGVELNEYGKRLRYWLLDQHPGSGVGSSLRKLTSRPVPASEVLHVFREERPGQVRGVSWFAPVIIRMRDLDDLDDARLAAAKVAAVFSAFVKTAPGGPNLSPLVGQKDNSDKEGLTDRLEPALIQYLEDGEEIEFAQPPSFAGYRDGASHFLRSIAAGLGVTYEMLTGDLQGVSFSGGRMGRLEFQRNVDAWRWQMFIPAFLDGVWAWAIEGAMLKGIIREPAPAEHHPPPIEPLDPQKEADGFKSLVRNGFYPHDHVVASYGFDPARHYEQLRKVNETIDANGLVLDTDPRKVSVAGLTQAPPEGTKIPPPNVPDDEDTEEGDDDGEGDSTKTGD